MTNPERRWGRAGQRLMPGEAEGLDRVRAATRNKRAAGVATRLSEAKQEWAAGQMQPHSITTALDRAEQHGPEVDTALGVMEPTVDWWEAGIVYPRWQDVLNLAELCKVVPSILTRHHTWIDASHTSLRHHVKDAAVSEPLVLAFTPQAVADTLRAEGVLV